MQTQGWPLCEGGGWDERLTTAGRDGTGQAIRSWPWWPADSGVCAVGARVARVEWWRGYRGFTA
ncbi:hypothetical protein GCM10010251_26780 [Streptomyces aurantiogriseus]|uniref:Uncharacterized protein n=1 Tax=Streptomyces aurantiogriseus TaxID=66870 RepID=A0A918C847_9ACTN|nr:hypothetical protein GCM10010251_26780 [Streptomyces aurantiogriseus]